jgi:hypothetical protein
MEVVCVACNGPHSSRRQFLGRHILVVLEDHGNLTVRVFRGGSQQPSQHVQLTFTKHEHHLPDSGFEHLKTISHRANWQIT